MQTTITEKPPVAVAGHVADTEPCNVVTRVVSNEATSPGIDYGMAAVWASALETSEDAIRVPTAAGQAFQGVVVFDTTRMQASVSPQPAPTEWDFQPEQCCMILRRGLIWVPTNGAVIKDGPAFFVNTGADAGKFRGDNTDAEAVPTGTWRYSNAAAGLALLELNQA